MEENELFNDIELAIKYLKSQKILISNGQFIFIKNSLVYVQGKNFTSKLTLDEFINLYNKESFIVYENNEEQYDFSKDDQYYNEFKHK